MTENSNFVFLLLGAGQLNLGSSRLILTAETAQGTILERHINQWSLQTRLEYHHPTWGKISIHSQLNERRVKLYWVSIFIELPFILKWPFPLFFSVKVSFVNDDICSLASFFSQSQKLNSCWILLFFFFLMLLIQNIRKSGIYWGGLSRSGKGAFVAISKPEKPTWARVLLPFPYLILLTHQPQNCGFVQSPYEEWNCFSRGGFLFSVLFVFLVALWG